MSKPQYHWGAMLLVAWWVIVVAGFGVIGNVYLTILLLKHGQPGPSVTFAIFAIGSIVYCYRTYRARAELRAITKR